MQEKTLNSRKEVKRYSWKLMYFPPINLWSLPHTHKYSYTTEQEHEFT
jgi:hypothetical protein